MERGTTNSHYPARISHPDVFPAKGSGCLFIPSQTRTSGAQITTSEPLALLLGKGFGDGFGWKRRMEAAGKGALKSFDDTLFS